MSGDLGINVTDNVRTEEIFGQIKQKISGIAGTLHLTNWEDAETIVQTAWRLSENSGKPVVIVVRAQ